MPAWAQRVRECQPRVECELFNRTDGRTPSRLLSRSLFLRLEEEDLGTKKYPRRKREKITHMWRKESTTTAHQMLSLLFVQWQAHWSKFETVFLSCRIWQRGQKIEVWGKESRSNSCLPTFPRLSVCLSVCEPVASVVVMGDFSLLITEIPTIEIRREWWSWDRRRRQQALLTLNSK